MEYAGRPQRSTDALCWCSNRRQVLALYRQVLQIHRDKLPGPLRQLGNTYVRDEFKRHRDAKTTPEQWRQFFSEWEKYAGMLSGQADLPGGSGDIPDEVLLSMNEEQKERLKLLELEAAKARDAMLATPPLDRMG